MKIDYQLETIPVWDGVQSNSECFLCDLMEEAQADGLRFYLGASVMNPETRVQVNEVGFCPEHSAMLVESGKPNSMAVLWETHLERTAGDIQSVFQTLRTGNRKGVAKLNEVLSAREKGCLICSKMNDRLKRYCFTTVHMWGHENGFRDALMAGKGFCLHHLSDIMDMASDMLSPREFKAFCNDICDLESKRLERSAADLKYMKEQYRGENINRPWNGCEDAQKRAVYTEIGKGRINNC